MYGNLYAIDNESIKYIKIAPHERMDDMQKNTIDKTEKTLVDVHVEFENGSVLDIDEVYMDEIRMDTDRTMLVPEGSAMLHTINLDKVNYITYIGEVYE